MVLLGLFFGWWLEGGLGGCIGMMVVKEDTSTISRKFKGNDMK